MLEHYKASIGEDQDFLDKAGIMMDEEEPDPSDSNYAHLKTRYVAKRANLARNRTLAISFLKRSYKPKYGALITDLENQYTRGTD